MGLCGIDAVIFGVEDMDAARKFLTDWGVSERSVTAGQLEFVTRDQTQVIVRPIDDAGLPPAIEDGNTVREVVWGVTTQADLDAVLAHLRLTHEPFQGTDGRWSINDPNGMRLSFRVSVRVPVKVEPTLPNAPGSHNRVDVRSPVYTQATPIQIGHVVVFGADFAAMRRFYTEVLGFVVSDEYPGQGAFMRCGVRGGHHNLFVLNRAGRPGVNHVAFTVSDIHEVIGGGLAMSRKGWKTEIGPGRHPISSAYFWYFENPLAAPLEYYADEDYCTENWQPQEFVRRPELFAEWAISGGLDGHTRRQARGYEPGVRGHGNGSAT